MACGDGDRNTAAGPGRCTATGGPAAKTPPASTEGAGEDDGQDSCGYPDCDNLQEDLQAGSQMLGKCRPAPGWAERTDGKYQNPIDMDTFRRLNKAHVQDRLSTRKVDPDWQAMLQE